MIIVYFKQTKFFRCSYLIRQMYLDENLASNPPEHIIWEKLFREIKTEKPIITLYDVMWDDYMSSMAGGNIDKAKFSGIDLMQEDSDQDERKNTMKQFGIGTSQLTMSPKHK